METLRKLVHRKKDGDRDHPSWRQMCKTWYNMVFSYRIRDCDPSSLEYKEWNPWKDWCQSWEQFQSSQEMPPKSEKRKAAMFAELSTLAKLTRDRLEEAKNHLEQKTKMNESLRNQNYILNNKCEELQQQLGAAEQKMAINNHNFEKVSLKRSLEAQNAFFNEKVKLEAKIDLEQKTKDSLRNQNYILNKKCEELQQQLNAAEQKIAINNHTLEKEVSLKRSLVAQNEFLTFQAEMVEQEAKNDLEQKTKVNDSLRNQNYILNKKTEELQQKLDASEQKIVKNNRILDKEVNLKRSLEAENAFLISQADQQEECLQQVHTKCSELEEKLSSLQSQLVESYRNPRCQINIKNDMFFFPENTLRQDLPCPQLENGECQNMLDLNAIREIIDGLGQVNSWNVFDWLCKFEEYKIWKFNANYFEQILRRCMDRRSFASLPTIVKMNQVSWMDICQYIAVKIIPDLGNLLDTEQMRGDDNVLQYFQRMWMIYRVTEYSNLVSKDDPKYMKAIFLGLRPHLYEEVKYLWNEDYEYEDIVRAALLAEHSWLESENWRMKTRKAGAGCPSRKKIWWKLLRKYHVPYEEIDEAPYWDLVVCLSKYEDLRTE